MGFIQQTVTEKDSRQLNEYLVNVFCVHVMTLLCHRCSFLQHYMMCDVLLRQSVSTGSNKNKVQLTFSCLGYYNAVHISTKHLKSTCNDTLHVFAMFCNVIVLCILEQL